MITICPRCQRRIVQDNNSGDIVHICNSGNTTLDTEDKIVVGNWEDYTGSKTVGKASVMVQGAENKLFGTRADIEGNRVNDLNTRGKPKTVFRQRQHQEYIKGGDENAES